MRLLRKTGRVLGEIWRVVGMPIAPRWTWGQSKWPVYFWRSVGVIVFMFLIPPANFLQRPVTFTDELSFEVVQQMEEAGDACRAARDDRSVSCGTEVWKACHAAKQSVENYDTMSRRGAEVLARRLCDIAVVADATELGVALASRYGDEYYRSGWFKTVQIDEGNASFLLFQELADFNYIEYHYGESDDYYDISDYYYDISGDTWKKLFALRSSIRYFFHPYQYYGLAVVPPELQAAGIRPSQDLKALGINLWKEPSSAVYAPGIPEQNCSMARTAIRVNQPIREELLERCFQLTDDCANRADSFSASCSLAKGAAEFESMWQRLPGVCARSADSGKHLTSAEETSSIAEPSDDACYQAALAICEYQNVSPEDEWLVQLILKRNFACAAAARTPDMQYVKVDKRVPPNYFQPQSQPSQARQLQRDF